MIQVALAQPDGFSAGVERSIEIGMGVRGSCHAMQTRRHWVRDLAKPADLVLLVGADHRSGHHRSREIGCIAGASVTVSTLAGIVEDVKFKFPAELH